MWVNNKKDGKGHLKWIDGSREYKGAFKDDERHGEGVYTWDHGTKSYRGQWRNGQKDGVGYVRDNFDFVEKKGLWWCNKIVKWLPKGDDDEGQDGDSIVSQDILDWENDPNQSNFPQPKIQSIVETEELQEEEEVKKTLIEDPLQQPEVELLS